MNSTVNQRHAVLGTLAKGRRTWDEAGILTGIEGAWRRFSELANEGLAQPVMKRGSVLKRPSTAGRMIQVWEITPMGREQLKAWNRIAKSQ